MLVRDLQFNIKSNTEFFKKNASKNPNIVYLKLNELANFVGKRYGLNLEIHFPNKDKINDVSDYGMENLSLVFDKFKKTFQIDRNIIKTKLKDVLPYAQIVDAYMYEGKEGLRITFKSNGEIRRLDILPGSLHIWTKLDQDIENYCNWLLENVYSYKKINNV